MEVTTSSKPAAPSGQRGLSGQEGMPAGDASAFLLALVGAQLATAPIQAPVSTSPQQGGAEGQTQAPLLTALAGGGMQPAPSDMQVPQQAPPPGGAGGMAQTQPTGVVLSDPNSPGLPMQASSAPETPAAPAGIPVDGPVPVPGSAAATPAASGHVPTTAIPAGAAPSEPIPPVADVVRPAVTEPGPGPAAASETVRISVETQAKPETVTADPSARLASKPDPLTPPAGQATVPTVPPDAVPARAAEMPRPSTARNAPGLKSEGGPVVSAPIAGKTEGETPEVDAASIADLTDGKGNQPGPEGRPSNPSPLGQLLRPFGMTAFDGFGSAQGVTPLQTSVATHGQQSGTAEVRTHDVIPHAKEISTQVSEALSRGISKDGSRIVVDLNPASLGRVEVIIEKGENGARARILVDRSETLNAIQADSRLLERSLADAGIDLSQGGMTFGYRERQEYREHLASLSADHLPSTGMPAVRRIPVPATPPAGGIDILV